MRDRRRFSYSNIHESFSDVALLMLATFVFLLVTILITSRVAERYQVPRLNRQVQDMQQQLDAAQAENDRLTSELGELAGMGTETQIEQILKAAGLGKKDFDLFVQGLKDLPGEDVHLMVDATGSMHGAVTFLVPVLRAIVIRSGKMLSAITWFSDGHAETYSGTMGEMFDQLMQGAPFVGANETIGDAFIRASQNARAPGAYLLIGDEPSDDRIFFRSIPSPVFTLPIGKANPNTKWQYEELARKTGGKMLHLQFK
jgi:cell division protein FtsL